jgi:hypothetical protein
MTIVQTQALASFDEDGVAMADGFAEIRKRFDEAFDA